MRTWTLFVAPVIALAGLTGCEKPVVEPRDVVQPVKIFEVSKAHYDSSVTYPAVAAAADRSKLSFRIAGEVVMVSVRAGDKVKKGQLLARLDPKDYQLAVDDAQAKYSVVNSQYVRSAKLIKKGFIAKSQVDELRAQRDIAKAQLDIAKLNLTFTQLKAPFSGVISKVPIKQFENVQVGETIMNIHSAKTVDIQLQVPDLIYARTSNVTVDTLAPGIGIETKDGKRYTAFLKEFTTEPDPESGAYLITLSMPMPTDKFILDGMPVEIVADPEALKFYRQAETVIPIEAIINEDGDALDKNEKYIWVVVGDRVEKRKVVTDQLVPNGIRLLSGVQEGEVIVIAGVNRLREGQQISVVSTEAK